MDYAIKLVVLSAATLAALAVGVSVLAMYRLVEPRRLAIISLVSAAIAAIRSSSLVMSKMAGAPSTTGVSENVAALAASTLSALTPPSQARLADY